MKRLWQYIDNNKLLIMLVTAATILTAPLVILCFYGNPILDDFVHAVAIKNILSPNYNLIEYFVKAIGYSFDIYRKIQGAYTINLFISLNPMVYNIKLIPIFYFVNFIIFIFTTFVFSNTLSRRVLHSDKKTSLIITSTILIVSLQFVSLAESFYWYAGAVGYTLPYSLMLLFLSNLIMIFSSKKAFLHTGLGVFMGFLLGGTNFPLGIFLSLVVVLLTLWSYLRNNVVKNNILLVSVSLIVGFIINLVAVGNSQRVAMGFEIVSPPKAVLLSFWGFAVTVGHVLSFSTILFFTIILIPTMTKIIMKLDYKFNLPLLLSVLSVGVASSLYTPAFYAGIGEIIPNRYDNITVFIIIWLFFINTYYWLGWIIKNKRIIPDIQKQALILVIAASISLQVPLSVGKLANISFISATRELATGVVSGYKAEVQRLYIKLSESPNQDVVYSIKIKTVSLQNINIVNDKKFWGNRVLAEYFGAKTLRSDE